ncbi:MAG: SIMPL domain-containing protein [Armatimonas sp.]
MDTPPDLITVSATHLVDLPAIGAAISLTVEGSSYFGGSAALEKVREVAALVADLRRFAIADENIKLRQVSNSHGLVKSSTVSYSLEVEVKSMEHMGDVLMTLAAHKSVKVNRTAWKYEDTPGITDDATALCASIALQRARRVAETLGVTLLGVHRCKTTRRIPMTDHEGEGSMAYSSPMMRMKSAASWHDIGGWDLNHTKTVCFETEIEFRVSPLSVG